jgi:flagellar biosynthesis protein FlhF
VEGFSIIARTEEECRAKLRRLHGDVEVRILKRESVPSLFGRKNVYRGYFAPSPDLSKYASAVVMGPRREASPPDPEKEREKILSLASGKDGAAGGRGVLSGELMEKLLAEIAGLKAALEEGGPKGPPEHAGLTHIRQALAANVFSAVYAERILTRARETFSLAQLDDRAVLEREVRAWIAQSLSFYDENDGPASKPRIFVLAGPTGVGKTTALVKLAFACRQPELPDGADRVQAVGRYRQKVALFSIDRYRIGADDAVKKYGELLRIPYQNVFDAEELRKEISFHREDADIMLVDTFGVSPHEPVKLARMKEMLDACGQDAEFHVAVSATTREDDMAHILRAFEPLGYRSVVLTKLDETRAVGGIISCLSERAKKVSFITTGQDVRGAIERGNARRILAKLTGFGVEEASL